jgi:hypothetical protein
LSLIPDIQWIIDACGGIINATPSYLSVNAVPGVVSFISNNDLALDEC